MDGDLFPMLELRGRRCPRELTCAGLVSGAQLAEWTSTENALYFDHSSRNCWPRSFWELLSASPEELLLCEKWAAHTELTKLSDGHVLRNWRGSLRLGEPSLRVVRLQRRLRETRDWAIRSVESYSGNHLIFIATS